MRATVGETVRGVWRYLEVASCRDYERAASPWPGWTIVSEIKNAGFNSVRIPWSNQIYEKNDSIGVDIKYVSANPGMAGEHPLQVLDQVITALGNAGLMVILDNHVSRADWCCHTDVNGLWYDTKSPDDDTPQDWKKDWVGMAERYKNDPAVIGVELRNELRAGTGVPSGKVNIHVPWHAGGLTWGDVTGLRGPGPATVTEGQGLAASTGCRRGRHGSW